MESELQIILRLLKSLADDAAAERDHVRAAKISSIIQDVKALGNG